MSFRWRVPKPLLVIVATAPIGLALFAFVFMVRNERAFDDERCPFIEGETVEVDATARVRVDARACQEGVEERRWVLYREGAEPREIGRRRLESHYFGEGYSWQVRDEEGRVRLDIQNPGFGLRVFREPARDGP